MVNLDVYTKGKYYELFLSNLLDGIAKLNFFSYSPEHMSSHMHTEANICIMAIDKPDQKDLEWMQSIKKRLQYEKVYLFVGSALEKQELDLAKRFGITQVLFDPCCKMRELYHNVDEMFSILTQGLAPQPRKKSADIICFGENIYFHPTELWVGNDQEKRYLSKREQELLLLFIQNEGCVISKDLILDKLWDGQADTASVGVLVKRLRNKMGQASNLIVGRKQGGYIYKKSNY